MYVFLLAGCEVVLSALIISLGNYFCLKKKPEVEEPEARLEMAMSACEKEGLNHEETRSEDGGPQSQQDGPQDKTGANGSAAGETDGEVRPENGV